MADAPLFAPTPPAVAAQALVELHDSAPAPDPVRLPGGAVLLTTPSRAVAVPEGIRTASEWAWRLAAIALGLYLVGNVLTRFTEILVPVMLALLLAALLGPAVRRLTKIMPHGLASFLALFLALAVVVGLFVLVGEQTVSGFPTLQTDASQGLAKLQTSLQNGPLHVKVDGLDTYISKLETAASNNRNKILSGAFGVASTATKVVEAFFITMFATFFFLSSGPRIWGWVLRILPASARSPIDKAGHSGWITLSYYVRATLIVALVDGVGVGTGAAVLGVPLAIPLGVIVFFGAFVPIVGALATGLIAILVAFVSHGTTTALIMFGIVLAVNQLEAHVLQPFLLGRAVEVHPLAVILSLAAGSALAGVSGALFAVPTVAVANTMITSLFGRGPDPAQIASTDSGPLSPGEPRAGAAAA